MGFAKEGEQVMLAHAAKADVADQDDFVVFLGEELLRMNARVLLQATKHLGIHPGHARRGLDQPFAIRVFANRCQNLANGPLDSRKIYSSVQSCLRAIPAAATFVADGHRDIPCGFCHELRLEQA
jgi:hypothetical protein